jgi:hypothetical protein
VFRLARKLWSRRRSRRVRGFFSIRPLVLLQSDDWGRVGVRDREGWDLLRAGGIELGTNPYDFYTLETAEDVIAARDLLQRHRDSTGRAACMGMNFVLANLDFARIAEDNFDNIHLRPLTEGLPGKWQRAGLFEAYRRGIADGVFYPALHGLTHFCQPAAEHELAQNGERAALLRTLWKANTPYIYSRMPWVGYEYCRPDKPHAGFLRLQVQTDLVRQAASIFSTFFSRGPVSACAPGYRANQDTRQAWSEAGVQVVQLGSGQFLPPYMDDCELLNVCRRVDFEPSQGEPSIADCMRLASDSFARGIPFVISVHSINFHSSLKDFRSSTLGALDRLLSALEATYSDLLYVHDGDLRQLVTQGRFESSQGPVSVTIQQRDSEEAALAGNR